MKVRFILLFYCSVGVQSTCLQAPVSQLPEGCDIGNLIVTSTSNDENKIIDAVSCDRNVSSKSFLNPPAVSLQLYNNSDILSSNQTYLLTAVDRTNEKLIWMVSNVTVNKEEMLVNDFGIVLPLAFNNNCSRHIIPYREPNFEQKMNLTVEFLVFEEHRNNASNSYIDINITQDSTFNLSAWIDAEKNSEITICGPVAGGSVVVIRETTDPIKRHFPSLSEIFADLAAKNNIRVKDEKNDFSGDNRSYEYSNSAPHFSPQYSNDDGRGRFKNFTPHPETLIGVFVVVFLLLGCCMIIQGIAKCIQQCMRGETNRSATIA